MSATQTIENLTNDKADRAETLVSVFIPCYNEVDIIERLLYSLYQQSYSRASLEIIIVDGMSTDGTRTKIKSFAHKHPDLDIKIVDNEKRYVTYALNIGLKAAKGHYLIRMDAHSIPAKDYIVRCIRNLQEGKGDNVGGLLDIQPANESYIARSIAKAGAHPLGSGGAQYRSGTKASPVDTVAFGAFTRATLHRNGYFNESLLANEDYEWNTRLKSKGGRIWFDPSIRCQYFSRTSYRKLAKQYFNYGYWKAVMLRIHPQSLRLRQMAAPAVVAGLLLSFSTIIVSLFVGHNIVLLSIALLIPISYFCALSIGCLTLTKDARLSLVPGIIAAIMIMHLSWGIGFIYSLLKNYQGRLD